MNSAHGGPPPAESGNANDEVADSVISRSRRSRGATANDPPNGRQAAPEHRPPNLPGPNGSKGRRMAFTFAAFCYMLALLLTAALIFFAIWHVSGTRVQPDPAGGSVAGPAARTDGIRARKARPPGANVRGPGAHDAVWVILMRNVCGGLTSIEAATVRIDCATTV